VITSGWRSAVGWVVLAVLCAVLTALAWRGYMNPAALIDFANQRLC
jgi:hypothetical protein